MTETKTAKTAAMFCGYASRGFLFRTIRGEVKKGDRSGLNGFVVLRGIKFGNFFIPPLSEATSEGLRFGKERTPALKTKALYPALFYKIRDEKNKKEDSI